MCFLSRGLAESTVSGGICWKECDVYDESFGLLLAGRRIISMTPSSSLQDLLGAFFMFSSMLCAMLFPCWSATLHHT